MILFDNPAVYGEALHAFFPETIVPKNCSVQEALEQLAQHQNPRHAEMATRLLALCRRYELPVSGLEHKIRSSGDVYRHYSEPLDESQAEKTMILLFAKNKDLRSIVSTPYKLYSEPINCQRHIMQATIENRARNVIAVQYCREEEPFPIDDNSVWHELVECTDIFDVRVMDYILIKKEAYYSVGHRTLFKPGQPDSPTPMDYW